MVRPSFEQTAPHEHIELHQAIRTHYEELLDLYESMWGEHIHHGYWDPGQEGTDRAGAQRRTVRELIAFGAVPAGARVLDAGCGVGAPAIHLARELNCQVVGITLSEAQVDRATKKAGDAAVGDRTSFSRLDAQRTGLPDGSFDVVWALESLELMPDKTAFFAEALRLLRPGGTVALTTWCARDEQLTPEDTWLVDRIRHDFAIPYMLPLERYERICRDLGFEAVAVADWTERVQATWDTDPKVVRRLLGNRRAVLDLARSHGVSVLRLLHAVPLMSEAYRRGVLRYGVLRASKPMRP